MRYTQLTEPQTQSMLETIGARSIDELFKMLSMERYSGAANRSAARRVASRMLAMTNAARLSSLSDAANVGGTAT